MPFHYTIDAPACLAYLRMAGTVTGEEVNTAYRAYLEDERWRPTFNVLWDGVGVTTLLVEWSDMERFRTLAASLEHRVGPGRAAIVVTRHVDLTMAKNYQLFTAREERQAKGREMSIFPSLDAAAEWLGLAAEDLDRIRAET